MAADLLYATGHPPGASTPNFPLHAHSVLSRGMAKTPLPRVRQQLPLQRLPAVRQQALHPTSAVSEGHLNVCPATLHTSPPHRGQQLPLRVATPLICPQALRQTSTASIRRSNTRRARGLGRYAPKYRLSVQQAVLVHAQPVVHLLIYSEMRDAPVDTSPPQSSATDAALFTPTDRLSPCHHQLRTSRYEHISV